MEDILDLDAEPYDPQRPVVCLDEYPYALTAATRAPLPARPGQPRREDYEYQRCGSCSLGMLFEPRTGWRHLTVTARRTKRELAEQVRALAEDYYPEATCIRVVLDNLNTHSLGTLYEVLPPERARRIARKVELHYTPVHASWLNMIEIEWSVLARQVLGQRLPDIATVPAEAAVWVAERNARQATVAWRFTTDAARSRLRRLYPKGIHDDS